MTTFAEAAAEFRAAAGRADASLARDTVEAMAEVYLPVLKGETPVLSGRLRDSETLDEISGGGASATAKLGPHTVYARFRNFGGTITAKNFPVLGNPDVGFFGKSVIQKGSHYMEHAAAAAQGPCGAAAQKVVDAFMGTLDL